MTDPTPPDPATDYLTALGDLLTTDLDEEMARQHVAGSSRLAAASRVASHSRSLRLGLLAPVLAILIGTSGVAVAGNLPHPVQGMVADAAHLLPVPVPIPYPTPTAREIPPPSSPVDSESTGDIRGPEAEPPGTPTDSEASDAAPRIGDGESDREIVRETANDGPRRDRDEGDDHRASDRELGAREGEDESDRNAPDRDEESGDDGDHNDREWDRDGDNRRNHDESRDHDREDDSGERDRGEDQGEGRDHDHRDGDRDRDRHEDHQHQHTERDHG